MLGHQASDAVPSAPEVSIGAGDEEENRPGDERGRFRIRQAAPRDGEDGGLAQRSEHSEHETEHRIHRLQSEDQDEDIAGGAEQLRIQRERGGGEE